MKKLVLVVVPLLLLGASGFADPAREADEAAIRALVARMAVEWNAHDMKAFAAHMAGDCEVVNRFGQWFRGRAKAEEHLVELHASPFRDRLIGRSSTVESVRFLTPEVALAVERAREETGQSIRTYLLSKQDGAWRIESATVTAVAGGGGPPPAR